MAKVIVEIDIHNRDLEFIKDPANEFLDGENFIVDEAYLERYAKDDCFFQFKLIDLKELIEAAKDAASSLGNILPAKYDDNDRRLKSRDRLRAAIKKVE